MSDLCLNLLLQVQIYQLHCRIEPIQLPGYGRAGRGEFYNPGKKPCSGFDFETWNQLASSLNTKIVQLKCPLTSTFK